MADIDNMFSITVRPFCDVFIWTLSTCGHKNETRRNRKRKLFAEETMEKYSSAFYRCKFSGFIEKKGDFLFIGICQHSQYYACGGRLNRAIFNNNNNVSGSVRAAANSIYLCVLYFGWDEIVLFICSNIKRPNQWTDEWNKKREENSPLHWIFLVVSDWLTDCLLVCIFRSSLCLSFSRIFDLWDQVLMRSSQKHVKCTRTDAKHLQC